MTAGPHTTGREAAAAVRHIFGSPPGTGGLGRDTKDYGLLFGPTNVSIHEVAIAVELGDADEAVKRGKNLVLPARLPRERSSHHYTSTGRGRGFGRVSRAGRSRAVLAGREAARAWGQGC